MDPGLDHLGQRGLEIDRLRRGQFGWNMAVANPDAERADNSRGLGGRLHNRGQQISRRGFAAGPGDADQIQTAAGPVEEPARRQRHQPARLLANNQGCRGTRCATPLPHHHCTRPAAEGLIYIVLVRIRIARQREENVARPGAARIIANAGHLHVQASIDRVIGTGNERAQLHAPLLRRGRRRGIACGAAAVCAAALSVNRMGVPSSGCPAAGRWSTT